MNLNIDGSTTTSISASASFDAGDANIESYGITISGSESDLDNKLQKKFDNLEPGRTYTVVFNLIEKGNDGNQVADATAKTAELELTTEDAMVTSSSSVRLIASTNCDATSGIGFEWRRIDAPEIVPSSIVNCQAVDGVLAGSLRNLDNTTYYQYRAFYTSQSDKKYYGEWIGFYTGDANVYFEPDVRTFDVAEVNDNNATIKGYALDGTEEISSQGFEYWIVGDAPKTRGMDGVNTVTASGINMSVTLTDLEYNSTYRYRAFATTASGTTYGSEMEFTTGDDPAGIEVIEQADSEEFNVRLRENPATGNAWVNVSGCTDSELRYFITTMSGATVATGKLTNIDGWNAIELTCPAGLYLLTVSTKKETKTVRLIVK